MNALKPEGRTSEARETSSRGQLRITRNVLRSRPCNIVREIEIFMYGKSLIREEASTDMTEILSRSK